MTGEMYKPRTVAEAFAGQGLPVPPIPPRGAGWSGRLELMNPTGAEAN